MAGRKYEGSCAGCRRCMDATWRWVKHWLTVLFLPVLDEETVLLDYLPLVRRAWWVTLLLFGWTTFLNFGGVLYVMKALVAIYDPYLPTAYLEELVVTGRYWDQLYAAIGIWLLAPLVLYFLVFWSLYRAARRRDSDGNQIKTVRDTRTRKRADTGGEKEKEKEKASSSGSKAAAEGGTGSSWWSFGKDKEEKKPLAGEASGKSGWFASKKKKDVKPKAYHPSQEAEIVRADAENPDLEIVEYSRYEISHGRKFLFLLAMFGIFCAFQLCVIALAGPFPAGGTGVVFQLQTWKNVKGLYSRAGGDAKVGHTLAHTFLVATALPIASNFLWVVAWAVVLRGLVFPLLREMRRQKAWFYIILAVLLSCGLFAFLLWEIISHLPHPESGRRLCFVNSCGETIRVGQVGGSTGIPCSEGCPRNTVCNPAVEVCYFGLPFPESYLAPEGSECVYFDGPPVLAQKPSGATETQQWSGSIYASTHCDMDSGFCETAVCNDCPAYQGPVGPVTQAEMTLLVHDKDFYDVTIINGVNIPLSMTPEIYDGEPFAKPDDPNQVMDYWCKSPGDPHPEGLPHSAASWHFVPEQQKTRYPLVVGGSGIACDGATGAGCPAGEVCGVGMMLNEIHRPLPTVKENVCGKLAGMWSDDALCAWTDASVYGNCKAPVDPTSSGAYFELYGCTGAFHESCFQNFAAPTCCGCSVWEDLGIKTSEQCKNNNPDWTDKIRPNLKFLKAACPSCYTYPYDDPTSTFTCKSTGPANTNSYKIEFCPGKTATTFA